VCAAIGWLRRERFDALVDLTPGFSRTNFIISQFGGRGAVLAGIEKESAAGRYHVHVGGLESHCADRILDVGEKLTGTRFQRPRPFEIYTDSSDREAAAAFVQGIKGDGPLIGINLSAGNSERQWAYGHFAELLRRFASEGPSGMKMALFSVGKQRDWAVRLAMSHSSCVAVPEFPFLTVVEIIAACSMLVSCDTALIHAAAARNVPVVGLYTDNTENFSRWGPYGIACEVIRSPSGENVNAIGPDAVYEKAMRLRSTTR
jgi:ADP-heptose:LPS heptosyltransferase